MLNELRNILRQKRKELTSGVSNIARNDFGIGVGGNGSVGRSLGNTFQQHIQQPVQQSFNNNIAQPINNANQYRINTDRAVSNAVFNNPNPWISRPANVVKGFVNGSGEVGMVNDVKSIFNPKMLYNAAAFTVNPNNTVARDRFINQSQNLPTVRKVATDTGRTLVDVGSFGVGKVVEGAKLGMGLYRAAPLIDATPELANQIGLKSLGRIAEETSPYAQKLGKLINASKIGKLGYYSALKGGETAAYNAANAIASGENKQGIKDAAVSGLKLGVIGNAVLSPKLLGQAGKEFGDNAKTLLDDNAYRNNISGIARDISKLTNKNEIAQVISKSKSTGNMLDNLGNTKRSFLNGLANDSNPESIYSKINNKINPPKVNINHYQEPGRQPGSVKNPFYKEPTPMDSSNPLINEARKYKSADEFVKEKTIYHGTYKGASDKISKEGFKVGSEHKQYANGFESYISSTIDEKVAQKYADSAGLNTNQKPTVVKIDKTSLKVLDSREVPNTLYTDEVADYARNKGYDAVDFSNETRTNTNFEDRIGTDKEVMITNPSKAKILNEEYLTDIYNQAHAKGSVNPLAGKEPTPSPLANLNQETQLKVNKPVAGGETGPGNNLRNNLRNELDNAQGSYEAKSQQREFVDSILGKETVNDIKRTLKSNAAQKGNFDVSKIEGFDKIADVYRSATGDANLTSSEILDKIDELPTWRELTSNRPASLSPIKDRVPGLINRPNKVGKVKTIFTGNQIDNQIKQFENSPAITRTVNNARELVPGSTRLTTNGVANVTDRAGNVVPQDVQTAIQKAILEGKDKSKLGLHNQTPVRNLEDIFGKDAQTIKDYLPDRAAKNETAKVDWVDGQIKGFKQSFKDLGIKAHSKEDGLAQDFAEKKISLEDLKQTAPKTWKNVVKASGVARAKYDQYLGQINEQLTKNGYNPIPKRADYVTHLGEISKFGDIHGLLTNTDKGKLPTVMSGIHLDTKPGRQFFKFGQARTGGASRSSLIDSLDAYIPSAGNQIFHTDTAQAARAFQKTLAAQIEKNPNTKALSNFTSWTNDYVNHLTGKGSIIDRSVEETLGRSIPKAIDTLRRRTSANMVGANISSALTNFIPLTQSIATTSKTAVAKGLAVSAQAPFEKNPDIIDGVASSFLKRRFGGDQKISSTLGQKAMGGANWIFQAVDKLVGKSIVSGKYYEGLQKGLDKASSMKVADDYAARIMADRSFGQTPTLYNSKTLGLLTQFQLEVNNQLSFLGKDIPKMTGGNKLKLASTLGQVAVYGYLFNNLFEKATGRRPAIDPIGIAQSTYSDYKDNKKGLGKNLIDNVANQLPYASTVTGGGRIPLAAGFPNLLTAGQAGLNILAGGDTSSNLKVIGKEAKKPAYYLLPPTGGGQAKKIIEGVGAIKRGYSQTDSGAVRFPVTRNASNAIKSTLFGQYASPEAQNYFKQGNTPLSDNQGDIFKSGGGADYYNKVISDRKTNASAKTELASLQSGKVKNPTKKVDGMTQLSNGKYAVKIGNDYKTFDDSNKASKAVETDKFQKSPANFKDMGSYVLRKNADGKASPTDKIDYNHDLYGAQLTSYKKNDNIKSWLDTAQKQYDVLTTKLADPNVDELDKVKLQNELATLVDSASKYQGYGGFKKGKKGRSGKVKKPSMASVSMPKRNYSLVKAPTLPAKVKVATAAGSSGIVKKPQGSKISGTYLRSLR